MSAYTLLQILVRGRGRRSVPAWECRAGVAALVFCSCCRVLVVSGTQLVKQQLSVLLPPVLCLVLQPVSCAVLAMCPAGPQQVDGAVRGRAAEDYAAGLSAQEGWCVAPCSPPQPTCYTQQPRTSALQQAAWARSALPGTVFTAYATVPVGSSCLASACAIVSGLLLAACCTAWVFVWCVPVLSCSRALGPAGCLASEVQGSNAAGSSHSAAGP